MGIVVRDAAARQQSGAGAAGPAGAVPGDGGYPG